MKGQLTSSSTKSGPDLKAENWKRYVAQSRAAQERLAALHARLAPTPDADEEIDVELVPLSGISDLIARGEITHSLVVAAFHLMALKA